MRVAILGATGFVGSAIASALSEHEVVVTAAPRLTTAARSTPELIRIARSHHAVADLAAIFEGCETVVNAAGNPDASSLKEDVLFGANALMPRIALEAARRAGVRRFVHVSSAVVQNDRRVLDESEDLHPFSPYSSSKVVGEELLREWVDPETTVVRYRPPSVHAPQRRVTRRISRIASSHWASVARPGDQPSPQALLPNVGAAVAFLAECADEPPAVVVHPWEGVTTAGLMRDLSGGHEPVLLPQPLARTVVKIAKMAGRWHPPTAANARRVELLWFGQPQSVSWLTSQGFVPPIPRERWKSLVATEQTT